MNHPAMPQPGTTYSERKWAMDNPKDPRGLSFLDVRTLANQVYKNQQTGDFIATYKETVSLAMRDEIRKRVIEFELANGLLVDDRASPKVPLNAEAQLAAAAPEQMPMQPQQLSPQQGVVPMAGQQFAPGQVPPQFAPPMPGQQPPAPPPPMPPGVAPIPPPPAPAPQQMTPPPPPMPTAPVQQMAPPPMAVPQPGIPQGVPPPPQQEAPQATGRRKKAQGSAAAPPPPAPPPVPQPQQQYQQPAAPQGYAPPAAPQFAPPAAPQFAPPPTPVVQQPVPQPQYQQPAPAAAFDPTPILQRIDALGQAVNAAGADTAKTIAALQAQVVGLSNITSACIVALHHLYATAPELEQFRQGKDLGDAAKFVAFLKPFTPNPQ